MRVWLCAMSLSALLGASGCAGLALNLLNADFLAQAGLGERGAALPGDAAGLLLEVDNRTPLVVEVRLTWRDGNGQRQERTNTLNPGERQAEAVICPVSEVTLGEITDLTAIGAVVRLGTGAADDPVIAVDPFGILLKDEVNYDCGDSVSFAVTRSPASLSGYQIIAFVRRS